MLTVETIRKIRLRRQRGESIRGISKELRLSRNTVRKALVSGQTEFSYHRRHQPHPRLGRFISELEAKLAADEGVSRKRRRSCLVLFEELQAAGYEGGYDSVRRYAKKWRAEHRQLALPVFIPLSFAPGQAFQFDWSEGFAELSGVSVKVNVSHLRLCHSRFFMVQAYPRQQQPMLFDAHIRGFEFFGGSCQQGIYDNPKTRPLHCETGKALKSACKPWTTIAVTRRTRRARDGPPNWEPV